MFPNVCAAIALSTLLALLASSAQERTTLALSFETADEMSVVQEHSARAARVQEHATAGSYALRVEFEPAEWPNVTFRPERPWDWAGDGSGSALAVDITNPGSEPLAFGIRVDDDAAANGVVHCRQGEGSIGPGRTQTFAMPLGIDPMSVGMRGLPTSAASAGMTSVGGSGQLELKHIVAFQVFMHQPAAAKTLILDNVRLVPWTASLDGIVDRFGQYTGADWPGKLHEASEFAQRRKMEGAELKAHPSLPGFDVYGGWAGGPTRKATGHFRTENVDGKWWLITPEGHLFFSMGIDCVGTSAETMVTGRERMFTWLPPRDTSGGEYAPCWGHVDRVHSGPVESGDTFNFFAANLIRKYGADYKHDYVDLALRRLRAWGFNTVGNWSDWDFYRNGKVPYVGTAGIGGPHKRVASGVDYWGTMHDPFDPQFAVDVRNSLRPVVERIGDDPWCLGYFVDNEISWGGGGGSGRYGLALGALALDAADSPAKRALAEQLRAEYGDIAKLNAAWGTAFADWSSFGQPQKLTGALNDGQRNDLKAFVKRFAETYFRTIRDELRRQAPHHLYLGCRFAWYTPEAAEGAAEFCDVVSFNIYQPKLDSARESFFASLNKPCIIGEFHFGALDRGMFHTGLVATANQTERARTYIEYLHSVLDSPTFVGCHWFQYVDEPLTGRSFDGENYNIGFVNVTDTPYPEMVTAAKQVHAAAYSRRAQRAER